MIKRRNIFLIFFWLLILTLEFLFLVYSTLMTCNHSQFHLGDPDHQKGSFSTILNMTPTSSGLSSTIAMFELITVFIHHTLFWYTAKRKAKKKRQNIQIAIERREVVILNDILCRQKEERNDVENIITITQRQAVIYFLHIRLLSWLVCCRQMF